MTAALSANDATSFWRDLVNPAALTLRLFATFWPQLMLLAAIGGLIRDLLMMGAVELGMANPLAGMVVLSFVVLAKLVVIVLMFAALKPGLPATSALRSGGSTSPETSAGRFGSLSVVAIAILPFFAYYAAWGFLGDTVREYSRIALAKTPFGESSHFLDLLQSRWLVASILACWAIRFAVKRLNAYRQSPIWPPLIVACDATWVFIGLYALSTWQEELLRWLGSGDIFNRLPNLQGLEAYLTIDARAADAFVPLELQGPGVLTQLQSLFFYALLPLVWLVMTAIIYGYDVAAPKPASVDRTAPRPGWRKWLTDFANHFLGGYRARYLPVLRCVRMVLGAGAAPLITLVIGYRLIGWLGAWAWIGITGLIGARELADWQLILEPFSLFIGKISDLDGGILLDPLRICLLAAIFECAVASASGSPIRAVGKEGTPAARAAR